MLQQIEQFYDPTLTVNDAFHLIVRSCNRIMVVMAARLPTDTSPPIPIVNRAD